MTTAGVLIFHDKMPELYGTLKKKTCEQLETLVDQIIDLEPHLPLFGVEKRKVLDDLDIVAASYEGIEHIHPLMKTPSINISEGHNWVLSPCGSVTAYVETVTYPFSVRFPEKTFRDTVSHALDMKKYLKKIEKTFPDFSVTYKDFLNFYFRNPQYSLFQAYYARAQEFVAEKAEKAFTPDTATMESLVSLFDDWKEDAPINDFLRKMTAMRIKSGISWKSMKGQELPSTEEGWLGLIMWTKLNLDMGSELWKFREYLLSKNKYQQPEPHLPTRQLV